MMLLWKKYIYYLYIYRINMMSSPFVLILWHSIPEFPGAFGWFQFSQQMTSAKVLHIGSCNCCQMTCLSDLHFTDKNRIRRQLTLYTVLFEKMDELTLFDLQFQSLWRSTDRKSNNSCLSQGSGIPTASRVHHLLRRCIVVGNRLFVGTFWKL